MQFDNVTVEQFRKIKHYVKQYSIKHPDLTPTLSYDKETKTLTLELPEDALNFTTKSMGDIVAGTYDVVGEIILSRNDQQKVDPNGMTAYRLLDITVSPGLKQFIDKHHESLYCACCRAKRNRNNFFYIKRTDVPDGKYYQVGSSCISNFQIDRSYMALINRIEAELNESDTDRVRSEWKDLNLVNYMINAILLNNISLPLLKNPSPYIFNDVEIDIKTNFDKKDKTIKTLARKITEAQLNLDDKYKDIVVSTTYHEKYDQMKDTLTEYLRKMLSSYQTSIWLAEHVSPEALETIIEFNKMLDDNEPDVDPWFAANDCSFIYDQFYKLSSLYKRRGDIYTFTKTELIGWNGIYFPAGFDTSYHHSPYVKGPKGLPVLPATPLTDENRFIKINEKRIGDNWVSSYLPWSVFGNKAAFYQHKFLAYRLIHLGDYDPNKNFALPIDRLAPHQIEEDHLVLKPISVVTEQNKIKSIILPGFSIPSAERDVVFHKGALINKADIVSQITLGANDYVNIPYTIYGKQSDAIRSSLLKHKTALCGNKSFEKLNAKIKNVGYTADDTGYLFFTSSGQRVFIDKQVNANALLAPTADTKYQVEVIITRLRDDGIYINDKSVEEMTIEEIRKEIEKCSIRHERLEKTQNHAAAAAKKNIVDLLGIRGWAVKTSCKHQRLKLTGTTSGAHLVIYIDINGDPITSDVGFVTKYLANYNGEGDKWFTFADLKEVATMCQTRDALKDYSSKRITDSNGRNLTRYCMTKSFGHLKGELRIDYDTDKSSYGKPRFIFTVPTGRFKDLPGQITLVAPKAGTFTKGYQLTLSNVSITNNSPKATVFDNEKNLVYNLSISDLETLTGLSYKKAV